MNSTNLNQHYAYVAYGLTFLSNLPIKGLLPTDLHGEVPSVTLRLGSVPEIDQSNPAPVLRYKTLNVLETGEPTLRVWYIRGGEFIRISYSDGVEFWLASTLDEIWAAWPENSTLDSAQSYLIGPVLGLLLRLRGTVCLHASAVNLNDQAIVFMGAEGAGKSTTAAGFAQRGREVLSDDIVALVELDQRFLVPPAYPGVNLWPDSVKLLYGSPEALPMISTDWNKRFLALADEGTSRFERRQLPVGAIYVFDESVAVSEQYFAPISKKDALLMLVANTYAANFLDTKQRAEEFAVLSRLIDQVSVRKVNPRRDVVDIDSLCSLIHEDFSKIDFSAR